MLEMSGVPEAPFILTEIPGILKLFSVNGSLIDCGISDDGFDNIRFFTEQRFYRWVINRFSSIFKLFRVTDLSKKYRLYCNYSQITNNSEFINRIYSYTRRLVNEVQH